MIDKVPISVSGKKLLIPIFIVSGAECWAPSTSDICFHSHLSTCLFSRHSYRSEISVCHHTYFHLTLLWFSCGIQALGWGKPVFQTCLFCSLHVYFWKLWWLYCKPEATPSTRSSKELKTNIGPRIQSSVLSAESQMYALLKVPYLGVRLWL